MQNCPYKKDDSSSRHPCKNSASHMDILLAFSPFLSFMIGDRFLGHTQGLIAGALVAAALLIRDWMRSHTAPKVLEVGTFILFSGLALYSLALNPDWSIMIVRLLVDTGLLMIVLISLAIRQPFTLQYARERVDRKFWNSPKFLRTNDVITAVWGAAFAIMVLTDVVILYFPDTGTISTIATVLALITAVKFTAWYPDRVAQQAK